MFTEEEFIQAVLDVANEKPNYRENYPDEDACSYVHGDQPGCLIGTALHRLGVPLSVLSGLEGDSADYVIDCLAKEPMSGDVSSWATDIQDRQDAGYRWGDVIDAYPPPNLPGEDANT